MNKAKGYLIAVYVCVVAFLILAAIIDTRRIDNAKQYPRLIIDRETVTTAERKALIHPHAYEIWPPQLIDIWDSVAICTTMANHDAWDTLPH